MNNTKAGHFKKIDEIFIRGNNIKYVRLPNNALVLGTKETQQFRRRGRRY